MERLCRPWLMLEYSVPTGHCLMKRMFPRAWGWGSILTVQWSQSQKDYSLCPEIELHDHSACKNNYFMAGGTVLLVLHMMTIITSLNKYAFTVGTYQASLFRFLYHNDGHSIRASLAWLDSQHFSATISDLMVINFSDKTVSTFFPNNAIVKG